MITFNQHRYITYLCLTLMLIASSTVYAQRRSINIAISSNGGVAIADEHSAIAGGNGNTVTVVISNGKTTVASGYNSDAWCAYTEAEDALTDEISRYYLLDIPTKKDTEQLKRISKRYGDAVRAYKKAVPNDDITPIVDFMQAVHLTCPHV